MNFINKENHITDNASGRQSKPDTVARGDCGVICIYAVKNRE